MIGLIGFAVFLLAASNRSIENIIVKAVVIAELKLRNVKWQALGADLVERADDAALKDRAESLLDQCLKALQKNLHA